MNLALGRPFRLVPRGECGLSCDEAGVALGGVSLVRVVRDGPRRAEVRPPDQLYRILRLAYGDQAPDVLKRCRRGLERVAERLQAGDYPLASLEALTIRLPDLEPAAMAKLARLADLEKAGTAWETQPRIPPGQHGGGQWTADGDGPPVAEAASGTRPVASPERRNSQPAQSPGGSDRRDAARPSAAATSVRTPHRSQASPSTSVRAEVVVIGADTCAPSELLPNPADDALPVRGALAPQTPEIVRMEQLAKVAADTVKMENAGIDLSRSLRGIMIHAAFDAEVTAVLGPGHAEISYLNGKRAFWGQLGSSRADAIEGPIPTPRIAYELKTQGARLTRRQYRNYGRNLPRGTVLVVIMLDADDD